MTIMTILYALTIIIYAFNFTGLKIKGVGVIAEGCLKDEPIDVVFGLALLASFVLFIVNPGAGQFAMLGFYAFVVCGQFYFTFRFMIWPNEKKIKNYNGCFKRTHYIVKPSETRLIPNTYHIIVFAILGVDLIATIVYIIL